LDAFRLLVVTIISCVGGCVGVLFTIPLRRALIVEQQLAFPEARHRRSIEGGDSPGRGRRISRWPP